MASNLPPVPPPERGDVSGPVKRNLISAGVLVVVGGITFAVLGLVRGDDDVAPEVAAVPTVEASEAPQEQPEPPASEEPGDEPASEEPAPASEEPEPPSEEPEPEPTPTPTPTPSPTPTPTPEPEPSPEPTATASEDGDRIPNSSISIQILDAVLDDGDQAVDKWRATLRDDGYRVVAKNDAIRKYEKTTVMYTAGFRAQAEQIAKDYGFTEVQEKPDNLSDSVQIHLVVGEDAR